MKYATLKLLIFKKIYVLEQKKCYFKYIKVIVENINTNYYFPVKFSVFSKQNFIRKIF